jgi:hypothetical protein
MSRGCNNETSIPALRSDVVINSKHTRYIQPKSQKGNPIPCTEACELGSGIFPEKVAGGGAEAAELNPSLSSSKKLRYSLSNTLP